MKRRRELKTRTIKPQVDKSLLYSILTLVTIGLVFIADISAPQALNFFGDKFYFLKQQVVWAIVGITAMIVVSNINYNFWKKLAVPIFFVTVLLLVAVLIPGISLKALGARRWISIGSINFQPSEVVKLALALYLAKVADSNIKKPLAFFLPLALVCGLIMLQPDLGTTLVVGFIGIVQIFVAGVPIVYFLGSLAAGIVGVIILIISSPYRRDRLMTFLQVGADPLGKEYHIRQILLAIGSGGLFGLGIGQSKQKYLFLPEASTDSIFAAIAEELGFLGSLVLILLFAFFLYKAFKVVASAPDQFSKILSLGIVAWIGGQIILNISAMTALTPLTGIPLPFFSYGGTSLSMILASCGILLNISRYANTKTITRR
ncbi:MAG: putative lipid II flippase FtsW [Microgenomates group bacterium]